MPKFEDYQYDDFKEVVNNQPQPGGSSTTGGTATATATATATTQASMAGLLPSALLDNIMKTFGAEQDVRVVCLDAEKGFMGEEKYSRKQLSAFL